MRVIGLGLTVVDHFYLIGEADPAAVRTRFTERLVAAGGMIGTATAQAGRPLGCDAHLLSAIGDDADGRFIRRSWRALGVNTRRLLSLSEFETTVAVVLVAKHNGERRFIVPDRRSLERNVPEFDLQPIRPGSVLMIDGHFPAQALRAVRRAREVGALVVGDFHRPGPAELRLLRYVDFPIVPQEFVDHFAEGNPRRAIRELARRYGGRPIVTLGARGGIYWDDGKIRSFPARRVRVVDTTGAGDVFHGAFAAGLARKAPIEDSIDLAVRAATHCCRALGGSNHLLTESMIRKRATPRSRARAAARGHRG